MFKQKFRLKPLKIPKFLKKILLWWFKEYIEFYIIENNLNGSRRSKTKSMPFFRTKMEMALELGKNRSRSHSTHIKIFHLFIWRKNLIFFCVSTWFSKIFKNFSGNTIQLLQASALSLSRNISTSRVSAALCF